MVLGVRMVRVPRFQGRGMVTRAQPGLEADVEVFRTLARHHRGLFGVWCDVLTGGTVSAGDEAIVGARRPEGGAHR